MIKKLWCILLCLGLGFGLQACIIDLFLAPKIEAIQLPGEKAIQPLKEAYIRHCGACHPLIHPQYFDRNHPIERYTQRYFSRKLLNTLEVQEVETYIRFLASQP